MPWRCRDEEKFYKPRFKNLINTKTGSDVDKWQKLGDKNPSIFGQIFFWSMKLILTLSFSPWEND